MKTITFSVETELQHQGICDASGAIALGEHHFVVANDENNILRIYDTRQSGSAVAIEDIDHYFPNFKPVKEADIEGAAQLGDIIYWITSHGNNKDGEFKPKRHQFFANKQQPGSFQFEQVGESYTQLLKRDLWNDPRFDRYRFGAAEHLPAKAAGGVNIEGLSITPAGELLIGFRNPIVEGKALIVPLKNPRELVEGTNAAILGDPIDLDLDGLGIRSVEYWASQNRYLIVAGAFDGSDAFALYHWSGGTDSPQPLEGTGLPSDFRPEAVLFYPHRPDHFLLLSDDGSVVRANGQACKEIQDEQHPQKYFRSVWVKVNS